MSKKVDLLIIDPQMDFCATLENPKPDGQPGTLSVPGAWEDMNDRLPRLIDTLGSKVRRIIVSLDSHQRMHIANPGFWKNRETGENPDPFTHISSEDVSTKKWVPTISSLQAHCEHYVRQLEENNKNVLTIWPEHCVVGTPGSNIVPVLEESISRWARDNRSTVDFIAKGSNPFTEHYSIAKADVPMSNDPGTQMNTNLIQMIELSDDLLIAGEALTHCLRSSVLDIREELGDIAANKWTLLRDCMSGIPTMRDPSGQIIGPDFDEIGESFLKEHAQNGGEVINSTDIIAKVVA